MSSIEKALGMLRKLPRVAIHNVKDLPEYQRVRKIQKLLPRGKDAVRKIGVDHKGSAERMSRPKLGFGRATPIHIRIPKEYYYENHQKMRKYVPLSLFQLQRLIDLGRVDPSQPIDLTTICNTKVVMVNSFNREFGVQLTDEGADIFKARVNIEVQWILEEATIAAIERNGGMVTTKFYDIMCVNAMADVAKFLSDGKPIPRNGTPPLNAIEYYTSAANRGYLADPDQVAIERLKLAQKYGYTLPPAEATCDDPLFAKRKDPRQIWHDLEPGSLVNLKDKTVIKPVDKRWLEFYKS